MSDRPKHRKDPEVPVVIQVVEGQATLLISQVPGELIRHQTVRKGDTLTVTQPHYVVISHGA